MLSTKRLGFEQLETFAIYLYKPFNLYMPKIYINLTSVFNIYMSMQ